MRPSVFFIILIHVFGVIIAAAPPIDLKFEHLTIRDGLSQNSVFSICRDSKGFMWFGTEDGLNKYDGYRFAVYRNKPGDPGSLGDNFIHSIYEDRKGNLWIGTRSGGLNRFDRKKNRFIRYPHPLGFTNVYRVFQDRAGNIWLGSLGGGLNKFDADTGRFKQYKLDEPDVTVIYEDQPGKLLIGTGDGKLYRFDPEEETFEIYWQVPGAPGGNLASNRIQCLLKNRNGRLLIGTEKSGLFSIIPGSVKPYKYNDLGHPNIQALYEDGDGYLWVGTLYGGIDILDPASGKVIQRSTGVRPPWGMSHQGILSFYPDHSGILWIGTWGGGLNTWKPRKWKFNHYRSAPVKTKGLSPDSVWAIYRDRRGTTWVGTENGLNILDTESGQFSPVIDPNKVSLRSEQLDMRSISKDRRGNIWLGTSGGLGLFDRDARTYRFYTSIPEHPGSLSHNKVWKIYEDREERLWVGTQAGLNLMDRSAGTFRHYTHDPANPGGLSHSDTRDILQDAEGYLWIATLGGGINRFEPHTGRFVCYRHERGNPKSLANDRVRVLFLDSENNLWAGTLGGGLNRFHRENGTFTSYTLENGLPNNVVYGILEDKTGCLWISTNNGLSKFNRETGEFKNYDSYDGLQSNEFNGGAYYRCESGEMFFGGIYGLSSFFPEFITDNPFPPPVVLTSFKKLNREFPLDTHITEIDTIDLTYKDSVISFEFAALGYTAPEKNRYAYKVEGLQDEWIHLDRKRDITLTNLEPGDYRFRVKAANNDGVWNEEGAFVNIFVEGPFWSSWWFRVLMLLLGLIAMAASHRFRTRILREQKENLEQQVAERTREFSESEEKYRSLVERARDGIVLVQDDFIKYMNPRLAELVERTQDDLLEKSIYEIVHPDERQRVKEIHDRRDAGQDAPEHYEVALISSEGKKIAVELSVGKVVFREKTAYLVFVHDLRDRKLLERERQKASKLESIGVLAGGIAHDFNDLLAVIMGNINLARISIDGENKLQKLLARSEKASLMAANLAAKFITFSAGGQPIKRKLDLREIVNNVVHSVLGTETTGENEKCRRRFDESLWEVSCDSEQIFHALSNLLLNAKDAINGMDNGFIELDCQNKHLETEEIPTLPPGRYVLISIKDNGIGIPEDNIHKIYDPYFTTKNEVNRKGLGLGLSIVYSIINKHNGYIDLSSRLKEGTIFNVYLPVD